MPLLATRYRLARLPDPFAALHHVDLFHPTRRAFSASGLIAVCRPLRSVCWASSGCTTCRPIWCLKPGLPSCGAAPRTGSLICWRTIAGISCRSWPYCQPSRRRLARQRRGCRCCGHCAILAYAGRRGHRARPSAGARAQLDTTGLLDLALLYNAVSSGTWRCRSGSVSPSVSAYQLSSTWPNIMSMYGTIITPPSSTSGSRATQYRASPARTSARHENVSEGRII